MLGPARFTHIETCATEVCKEFKRSEELQDCITTLRTLDDLLSVQREQLATLTSHESTGTNESSSPATQSHTTPRTAKKPDYGGIDVTKAKRLIHARESAIKGVKALIAKKATPS